MSCRQRYDQNGLIRHPLQSRFSRKAVEMAGHSLHSAKWHGARGAFRVHPSFDAARPSASFGSTRHSAMRETSRPSPRNPRIGRSLRAFYTIRIGSPVCDHQTGQWRFNGAQKRIRAIVDRLPPLIVVPAADPCGGADRRRAFSMTPPAKRPPPASVC